jgi:hypothetical protein
VTLEHPGLPPAGQMYDANVCHIIGILLVETPFVSYPIYP